MNMGEYCKCETPEPMGQYGRDKLGNLHWYCDYCELEIEPVGIKENRILVTKLKIAEEWLENMHDIAIGYDGNEKTKDLKGLIDELRGMAKDTLNKIKEAK